jgi:hypothetical protein
MFSVSEIFLKPAEMLASSQSNRVFASYSFVPKVTLKSHLKCVPVAHGFGVIIVGWLHAPTAIGADYNFVDAS